MNLGEVNKVKVLKNKSNKERIVYEFEILENIKMSGLIVVSEPGETFDCNKVRGVNGIMAGWFIDDKS